MFLPSLLSPVSSLALIGDVGGLELLVILTASLMLFGGKGLPGIARSLGKISRDLQRASQDFKNQLLTADEPVLPELSYHEPEFTDQTAEINLDLGIFDEAVLVISGTTRFTRDVGDYSITIK